VIRLKKPINDLISLNSTTPGIFKPQLAQSTPNLNLFTRRFKDVPFSCEYTYKAPIGQVHRYNNKIEFFLDNTNMTKSYQDVLLSFEKSTNSENFIIDCEVVTLDKKTKKVISLSDLKYRNIQSLSTPDHILLYDIIYLDNKSLLTLTLRERRKILLETFKDTELIKIVKHLNTEGEC
jgi:ATP-dependent DNA ligase